MSYSSSSYLNKKGTNSIYNLNGIEGINGTSLNNSSNKTIRFSTPKPTYGTRTYVGSANKNNYNSIETKNKFSELNIPKFETKLMQNNFNNNDKLDLIEEKDDTLIKYQIQLKEKDIEIEKLKKQLEYKELELIQLKNKNEELINNEKSNTNKYKKVITLLNKKDQELNQLKSKQLNLTKENNLIQHRSRTINPPSNNSISTRRVDENPHLLIQQQLSQTASILRDSDFNYNHTLRRFDDPQHLLDNRIETEQEKYIRLSRNIPENATYEQLSLLDENIVKVGLHPHQISMLPRRKATNIDLNVKCSICLSEFESSDLIITLPCFCFFHEKCCLEWLKHEKKCPVCRLELDNPELYLE